MFQKYNLRIFYIALRYTKNKKCVLTSQIIESNVPLQIEEVGLIIYCGDMIIKYYNIKKSDFAVGLFIFTLITNQNEKII